MPELLMHHNQPPGFFHGRKMISTVSDIREIQFRQIFLSPVDYSVLLFYSFFLLLFSREGFN